MSNDGTTTAAAGETEIGQVTFEPSGNVVHVDVELDQGTVFTTSTHYATQHYYDPAAARRNAQHHREFAHLMDRAANILDDYAGMGRRFHIGEITFASNGNVTTVEYDNNGQVIVTDSQGARRTWTPREARRLAEDHAALVHMLLLASREAETPF